MGKVEKYQELMFQLGDLARDRLANKPHRPKAMARVFKAEEAVVQRRQEMAALEHQMNEEDQGYRQFLEDAEVTKKEQSVVVHRFRHAVDAVEGKVKGLRRSLGQKRMELSFARNAQESLEARVERLEQEAADARRIGEARDNLKRQKIAIMRGHREIEDLEVDLRQALTPAPGQPGAAGIVAHRVILELEDEAEQRKVALDEVMTDLDAAIAQKEEEIHAAEDFLDQALYLLGEECYQGRVPDAELSVLYPKLDKLK
jgi:hypothetical protein